ncbi:EF-hand domain-containing protein [uncultured Massilia sp.]|uniref:EF-hand domain-containing protein n=1 Tax=uncultured Massilia sp. TaxID=169973 RepID=UPI0025F659A7|nr:EF-hand domain-containing protein [uncultured Massilia sp.]
MVAGIGSGNVPNRADSVFSRLDTRNQGYLEKADLQSALGAAGDGDRGPAVDLDATFGALDGDSDGKVTKSEMTAAMTRLSGQLDAQYDATRVAGGQGGMQGMGGGMQRMGDAGAAKETDATSSTSNTYVAAADTDGDGTVSDTEQAAYDKTVASGELDASGGPGKAGGRPPRDPVRELAHAMNLLKTYADHGGSDGPAAATGSTAASVSVEA